MATDSDLARVLWDYNHLNHRLESADFIFVMCSYNIDVADRAYELFCNGMGNLLLSQVVLPIKTIY